MDIDGNTVRIESIDAVTEIDITVDGAYEGTDKIVVGKFTLYIQGLQLTIRRGKRCHGEMAAIEAAKIEVRKNLVKVRDSVVGMIN